MTLRTVISKLILLPCSKIYGAVTFVRNKFFDWGILKQHEFDVPIIVVGNLTVGGTGKTPHVEHIVEAMRHSHHVAVLSRGYKRRTKGFVLANPRSTPRDIGDEAFQIYHKFNGEVIMAVCEKRVDGINELLRIDPQINLIVLDDAFQHRYVKPTVAILITEYGRPVYEDSMLPYGRLRESVRSMHRADIVITTKCPEDIKQIDYRLVLKNLDLYPYQELFFSRYEYQNLVPLFPDAVRSVPFLDWMTRNDTILAVAGIGNPRPFIRYLKSFLPRVKVNVFPDHHNYTRKDIDLIKSRYNSMKGENRIIITTEKDAVRLVCNPYFPHELKAVTFYVPIKVEFINRANNDDFANLLRKLIKQK